MVITANVEKSSKLFDKVKYTTGMKILDAYYLAKDENSDTSKVLYTVSAILVEIFDSLRNLDFCVLHLKRTMGIVNITLMD